MFSFFSFNFSFFLVFPFVSVCITAFLERMAFVMERLDMLLSPNGHKWIVMLFDCKTQIRDTKLERMTVILRPKITEQMCWVPYFQQGTLCSPKATYTGGLLGNRKNFFWWEWHTASQNSLLCYYLLLLLSYTYISVQKSTPFLSLCVDYWTLWPRQALAALLLTQLQSKEGTRRWSGQGHGGAWRHRVAITNSTTGIPVVARRTAAPLARHTRWVRAQLWAS